MDRINHEELTGVVQEAFRYNAPACIGVAEIIHFVEWAEKYTATEDEILASIDQLLRMRFVAPRAYGWQISFPRN